MQLDDIIPVRYGGAVHEARIVVDRSGRLVAMFQTGTEFHMIPTTELIPALLSPAFDSTSLLSTVKPEA